MEDNEASGSSRVSVSRTLLNLTYRFLEVDEFNDRRSALEGARFERPPQLSTESTE